MSSILLFVIITNSLAYEFEPNLSAIKTLSCYQCSGISSNNSQLCNQHLFKLARPDERLEFMFICPPYQKTYCFKQIKYFAGHTETLRGCSGPNDLNGNQMKFGCVWRLLEPKQKPYKIDFCLCDSNFCNQTTKLHTTLIQILFFILVIFT